VAEGREALESDTAGTGPGGTGTSRSVGRGISAIAEMVIARVGRLRNGETEAAVKGIWGDGVSQERRKEASYDLKPEES
jgi:hypothetical protein